VSAVSIKKKIKCLSHEYRVLHGLFYAPTNESKLRLYHNKMITSKTP